MRMRIRGYLLMAALLLIPATGFAQTGVPPSPFVGPLSGPRPESGGMYVGFNFIYLNTNRPLKDQEIAKRGFYDLDNSTGLGVGDRRFVGSEEEALNVNQVRGPGVNQPGWDMRIGWKFESGVAVALSWRHLVQARYFASAGILPPSFNTGTQFENTFLSSPVVNFPADWGGNVQNLNNLGTPATTFGIWNAASIMSIEYTQRYDIYSIDVRIPMVQTDSYRSYGLFGPRIVWIWDRFQWRTVDVSVDGESGPDTTAIYSNTISNRMYGVHCGFGNDWFLGHSPIGGFSFELDIEGGLYLDLTKTRIGWERGDRQISSTRGRRLNAIVPAAEIRSGLKWYPWEGITFELGYDITAYFNTISSPRPVDFDLSTVDAEFKYGTFRWFHGIRFGMNFSF